MIARDKGSTECDEILHCTETRWLLLSRVNGGLNCGDKCSMTCGSFAQTLLWKVSNGEQCVSNSAVPPIGMVHGTGTWTKPTLFGKAATRTHRVIM